MDVRDLEVFLGVAKHLNFTRAAEEVNLSQPSVSVRIRQLEEELGVKLFEQLGKRVGVTEAGSLLIPHARRVITAIEDAKQAIYELQGLERGSLRNRGKYHAGYVSNSEDHRTLQSSLPED